MIVGISGKAGSGKDAAADILVRNSGFVKVALADPLKRICKDVYDFTDDQLWGPSSSRNAPDKRYPREGRFIYPAVPEGSLWMPIGGEGRTLLNEADLELFLQHKWCVNQKESGKKASYVRTTDSSLKLHQLLLGPAPEGQVVDHINGDGMDNRRENLRFCTHAENHANEGKRRVGSSSFKGVNFDSSRNKWSAKLTVGGKTRNLGRFDTEEVAALAYDKAAVEAFGLHARTNASLFLTPRFALQQLGTNWGRACYDNTWVDYAITTANKLLRLSGVLRSVYFNYDVKKGLYTTNTPQGPKPNGVVISDVRFKNEIDAIRAAGGVLIRMLRGTGLSGQAGTHVSETQMGEIPDSDFDFVIDNRDKPDEPFTLANLEDAISVVASDFRRKS